MEKNIQDYQFLKNIEALPYIEEIWLFGSRARGDERERSDIDLAIICPSATENDWYKILDIQSNADTLLKIDCVRFDKLQEDDPLRKNILKYKKIIYKQGA